MDSITRFFRSSFGTPTGTAGKSAFETMAGAPVEKSSGTGQDVTLLEFFQSQSCDSCPPANACLIKYASRPDVASKCLLLTYHVTYWNHLSWVDTFSHISFTSRQRDYARQVLGHAQGLYTPMLVVNGRSVGIPNSAENIRSLVAAGQFESKPDKADSDSLVTMGVQTNQHGERLVTVNNASLPAASDDAEVEIVLITYIPFPGDVLVTRGENAGRTLPHRNVVESATRIGYLQAECFRTYTLRPNEAIKGRERAVVVQAGRGGKVRAVLML